MRFLKERPLSLVCVLLVFLLTGCQFMPALRDTSMLADIGDEAPDTTQYTGAYLVYEIGSYDASDGGDHKDEYAMWSHAMQNFHYDETAPKRVSIEFNGKTYAGTYLGLSNVTVPNNYLSHSYKGEGVYFEIHSKTGALSSIRIPRELEKSASVTEEACRDIADRIAGAYINVKEYQVEVIKQEYYNNYTCVYRYYREFLGYKTSDMMAISVDGNGNVLNMSFYMLGDFAEFEVAELFDMQDDLASVSEAIDRKLQQIYQDVPAFDGFSVVDIMPIRTEDGNIAFLYTTKNSFTETVGESSVTVTSLTRLLVQPEVRSAD